MYVNSPVQGKGRNKGCFVAHLVHEPRPRDVEADRGETDELVVATCITLVVFIFSGKYSKNDVPLIILTLVCMFTVCDDPGRIKVRRMNKGQNAVIQDFHLTLKLKPHRHGSRSTTPVQNPGG